MVKVLAFTAGQIEVYVNGILMDDSDFTTTGTGTVTLASAANLNDVINIVSFDTNIPDSNYVPATGGTFTGDVTHTGAFTSQGIDDNANATAITIDSSENVLVGQTTASDSAAGVYIAGSGRTSIVRDGGFAIRANRLTSDGEIVRFAKDGTTVGAIGSNSGSAYFVNSSTGGIRCGSLSGSTLLLPTNENGASEDAVHDLGYSTVRWRNLYLSGGAYIGGTAAANHLDEYEEGTFSGRLSSGYTGSVTHFTTASTGYYIKIGRLVHWQIHHTNSPSGGSSAQSVYLTGLPFTTSYYGSTSNWLYSGFTNIGAGQTPITRYQQSSDAVIFQRFKDGVSSSMQYQHFGGAMNIMLTGTYYTTS